MIIFRILFPILVILTACRPFPHNEARKEIETDSITVNTSNTHQAPYFILQNSDKKLALCNFNDNKIIEIQEYPSNTKPFYSTDGKTQVALLDSSTNLIRLYHIKKERDTILHIPYQIQTSCILMNENNIFVGGIMIEEMLIGYNIENDTWFELEIPEEIRYPGKAIDDLLFNGDQLIAIDNIVIPKFVLFYDIRNSLPPVLLDIKDLAAVGTYESIKKGYLSEKYLALISTTHGGWSGDAHHITIYRGLDLQDYFSLSLKKQVHKPENYEINDLCVINDVVWIAFKEMGLGKLVIDNHFFLQRNDYEGWEDLFTNRIDIKNVTLKAYPDEEIERLTVIPNTKKILLTIKQKKQSKRRYEIIAN